MNLRSAHHCVNTTAEVLKVGDVVLVAEDKMPRQTWKTGKIEDVFLGRDGLIRACSVLQFIICSLSILNNAKYKFKMIIIALMFMIVLLFTFTICSNELHFP